MDLKCPDEAAYRRHTGGSLITVLDNLHRLSDDGADITVRGRNAVIRGVEKLHGACMTAGDLRGGAALVIAALKAEGESSVADLSHIDRGYADFEYKLKKLGARIRRVRV